MSANYIKLHTDNNGSIKIRVPFSHSSILDALPEVFRGQPLVPLPNTRCCIDLDASSETHAFIARENWSQGADAGHLMDVFAIRVGRDRKIKCEEAFNKALQTFPSQFLIEDNGGLTAYWFSGSCNEQGYPCGTIFTTQSDDRASNSFSSSAPSSYQYGGLNDHNNHALFLGPPTPAENTNNNSDSSTRKGEVQSIPPLRAQHVEESHKLNLFSDNAGFTGPQAAMVTGEVSVIKKDLMGDGTIRVESPIPDIRVEGVSSPAHDDGGMVISPSEETSESTSTESAPQPPPERGARPEHDRGPKIDSKLKSLDAMVTGHIPRPDSLTGLQLPSNVGVRRRLSDVGPPNLQVHVEGTQRRPRANSDLNERANLDVQNLQVNEKTERANLDVQHLQVLNREQSLPSPSDNEPPKPVFLRSVSGPPTTPVMDSPRHPCPQLSPSESSYKPPGIQRQESCGEHEIVVGKKIFNEAASAIKLCHCPPSNLAVLQSDTEQVQELGEAVGGLNIDPLGGNQEVVAVQANDIQGTKEAVLTVDVPPPRVEVSGADSADTGTSYEESDGGVTSSGCGIASKSEVISETVLYQVHLLGHACNDRCYAKGGCPYVNDPAFAEKVEQMLTLVERLEQAGEVTEDLKQYIRIHCSQDCPGESCLVPHRAAGCPPSSVPCFASNHTPNHSPLRSLVGVPDCSVDNCAAFDSRATPPDLPQEAPRPPMVLPLQRQGTPMTHAQRRFPPASATPTPHRVPLEHAERRFQDMISPYHVTPFRINETDSRDYRHPLHIRTPGAEPHFGYHDYQVRPLPPTTTQHHWDRLGHYDQGPPHYGPPLYQQQAGHQGGAPHGAQPVSHEEVKGRPTYTYPKYDPNKAARLRLAIQQNEEIKLPDVGVDSEDFPEHHQYRGVPAGTMVYSSSAAEDSLVTGGVYPLPRMDRENLGKGGNGKVSKHMVAQREYAVKETNYRPAELNAWLKLNHPNLVPLLGVMLADHGSKKCYQFMPKMTDSLSNVMRKVGCFEKLSKEEDPAILKIIAENVWHVLTCALLALEYLESCNMQHCDVKASNVLVRKRETCPCQDILHCKCPEDQKCEVMLADFDSLKETAYRCEATHIPVGITCSAKTPEQAKKVMGTPGHRAPEQFHQTDNEQFKGHFEGPWCDIWSLGMLILRLCLGRDSPEDRRAAHTLIGQPHRDNLDTTIECQHAKLKHTKLCLAACRDPNLKPFAELADLCLKTNFRDRPRASELLDTVRKMQ